MPESSMQQLPSVSGGDLALHLPVPLQRLRDHAAELLKRAFNNLFLGSDDVLLQLASDAASTEDQNSYFEYLREIRLQRRPLLEQYFVSLDRAFVRIAGFPDADRADAEGSGLASPGDIPAFDSIELALALETSIAATQKECAGALQALIAALNPSLAEPLTVRNFPLGPRVLCDSFRLAAESLQMDGRGKQILGRLFDRAIVQQLDRIYLRLLEVLRAAEVAVAASVSAGVDTGVLPEGLRDLGTLRHPDTASALGPVTHELLLQMLTELQRHDAQRLSEEGPVGLQTLEQLQGQLQQLCGAPVTFAAADWRAMTLMQKMVEFIVQDQSLPPAMQRLLSGLHIPLLKVSVLDDAVFSEAGHSARRLLNELANAALGWQERDGTAANGLYGQVKKSVVYLLLNFTDDITVLQQVLNQFHSVREQESRRASLLERRTIDAEDGKAAGERARQLVDAELHPYLVGGHLPACVTDLLQGAWHKVMVVTLLQHGAASDVWHSCRDVVATLVWSVTAPMDSEGRAKLMQALPGLLAQLREGLELVAMDADQRSQLLAQLQQIHLQRLSDTTAAASSIVATASPPETPVPQPESDTAAADPAEQELYERVDRVAKGSWFEVRAEGSDPYRCRLAAVIPSVDKYIFVDRSGLKVAEKTRRQFAMALASGEFAVLDDGMLFDRALSAVIGDVRRGRVRS